MKRITAILVLVFIMLLSTKIVFAEDSYWAILGIKLGAPAADVTSLLTNNFSNAQIYTIRQTITVGEFKSAPLTLGVNMLQENRIDFLRGPHVCQSQKGFHRKNLSHVASSTEILHRGIRRQPKQPLAHLDLSPRSHSPLCSARGVVVQFA